MCDAKAVSVRATCNMLWKREGLSCGGNRVCIGATLQLASRIQYDVLWWFHT